MQAGSNRSMTVLVERTDEVLRDGADAERLGDDLFAFATTLDAQHALRRALTEPAVPGDAKNTLLRSLVDGKLCDEAVSVLEEAVRSRWSRSRDLADAVEQASVTALVTKADADGNLDNLEDNLFRFGRIVEANEPLRELLSDSEKSLEGKRKLLATLLDGKVDAVTTKLLGQAVAARHHSLPAVLSTYQKVAAQRRESVMATVWVAAPLSDDQKQRLAAALAAEYSHEVHLNVIVDPEVLGGVRVAVGDEIIDSTVSTRLTQARRRLDP